MTNSTAVPNPPGGAEGRRCATQPALHDNPMQAVLAPENMQRAWKQVKSNKGAPCIDRTSVQDFPDHARVYWPGIRQALIDGRYRPQPVRQVMIAKPGGGERMLGIPTIRDRVAQMAMKTVVEPIFEADFCSTSYGFRPRKSAHDAINDISKSLHQGYAQVIDADLSKYFDSFPTPNRWPSSPSA